MALGHLTPYSKNKSITCPDCEGEGWDQSWEGIGIPPFCDTCGGEGMISKPKEEKDELDGLLQSEQ